MGVNKVHYFPQCDVDSLVCMKNDLYATVTGITVDRKPSFFRKDLNVPKTFALPQAPTGSSGGKERQGDGRKEWKWGKVFFTGGWTLLPQSQYNVTVAHSETTAPRPHTTFCESLHQFTTAMKCKLQYQNHNNYQLLCVWNR